MRLRVILPTRERPDSLTRFVNSFAGTAELPAALTVVLDDDDPASQHVMLPDQVERMTVPRVTMGPTTVVKVNAAALAHLDDSDVLMFLGDDNVFRTRGWDRLIAEAFTEHGPGFVHVNDLGGRENIVATNIAISTSIVKALGYFDYPGCLHYSVDAIWRDLGKAAGCLTYLPGVIIEHLHWLFGKAPVDALYARTEAASYASDEDSYQLWREKWFASDLAKVLEVTGAARQLRAGGQRQDRPGVPAGVPADRR